MRKRLSGRSRGLVTRMLVVGVAIAAILTVASTASGKPTSSNLNVTEYGGAWATNFQRAVGGPFSSSTGVNLTQVLGSDTDWFAKLQASGGQNPPYDVAILQPNEIQIAVADHLLQPIDTKRLKYWKEIDPNTYKGSAGLVINGKIYGVPFSVGQLGLAYRTDKIKTKPTSWLDLWKPAYAGHVALAPPSFPAVGLAFLNVLVHTMGGKMSNPASVQAAFAKMAQLKSSLAATPTDNGTIQTLFTQGDIWIMPWLDGRALTMRVYGHLPMGFSYPKQGTIGGGAPWVIPTGLSGSQLDLVYKFLNYVTAPGPQEAFGESQLYGMSNDKVKYSKLFTRLVSTGPKAYANMAWPDPVLTAKYLPTWQNEWQNTMG